MTNGKRSGFDWQQFEKMMGTRLPFLPKDFAKGRMDNGGDWVGEYVEQVLKRSFSGGGAEEQEEEQNEEREGAGTAAVAADSGLDYDYKAFETHTGVIVRVQLPAEVHIRNVRVYAAAAQLKLEQDPSRKKLYIKLPHPIDPNAVKASFKDRVLEIRAPKLDEAEMFQEVRIRHI